MTTDALEAIDRVLNRGGDPDLVLHAVVGTLVERGGCAWAGMLVDAGGRLTLGPQAGEPQPDSRMQIPVVFQGERVAELVADGCDDHALLERVALLVSPYCRVEARQDVP
jgi:hypothetical protein